MTSANDAAVKWIDLWPNWPAATLMLTGPHASGKTHLASVWQARCGARFCSSAELSLNRVADLLDLQEPLIIEDAGQAAEQPLLHLLNGVAEQGRFLLLTAVTSPGRWATRLPDLASRLRALPVAEIAPPDDALLAAVLRKGFADRGVKVEDDLIRFLTQRIERSFAAAEQGVTQLDQQALIRKRPVSLTLAREMFANGSSGGLSKTR